MIYNLYEYSLYICYLSTSRDCCNRKKCWWNGDPPNNPTYNRCLWLAGSIINSAVLLNLYAIALLYVMPNITELQTSNQTGQKTPETKSTYITLLSTQGNQSV